jgi:hypothetical protein
MAEALAAIEVDFAPEEVAAIERLTGGRDSLARAFDV